MKGGVTVGDGGGVVRGGGGDGGWSRDVERIRCNFPVRF